MRRIRHHTKQHVVAYTAAVMALAVLGVVWYAVPTQAASPIVANRITSRQASNVSSHTVLLPAGSAGDLLLAFFAVDENPIVTWPAGWTEIKDIENIMSDGNALNIAYRQADGMEGASMIVTTDTIQKSAHVVLRITGHEDPLVQPPTVSIGATGDSATPDPDSLTPTGFAKDYLWIVAANGNQGGRTIDAAPTGYANPQSRETGGSGSVEIATAERSLNAVSENPGTFFVSAGAIKWAAVTVAVHPAAAGNAVPSVTSVTDNGPVNEGGIITFTVDWNDPGDMVRAFICQTNAIDSVALSCPGGEWTSLGAFVDSTNDPINLTYTTVAADVGMNNYYAFVCDDEPGTNLCSPLLALPSTFTVNVSGAVTRAQLHKTGTGTTASATFAFQPTQGNLLVAISFHRKEGVTPFIDGMGWNLEINDCYALASPTCGDGTADPVADINSRRALAMWWKIAGPTEPSTIKTWWDTASQINNLMIQEFSAGGDAFSFNASISNDSASNAVPSLTTGTIPFSPQVNSLLVTAMGARGNSGAITDWIGSVGDNRHYLANSITLQSAFGVDTSPSAKESTADWPTAVKATAAMLVFNVGAVLPTVDLQGYSTSGTFGDGPISMTSGNNVELQWTVSNAGLGCTASGGWTGPVASVDGIHTQTITNVTVGTTFTIVCDNMNGSSPPDSFEVRILAASPFTATPDTDPDPLTTTLSATAANTIPGPAFNYSFWWDCLHTGTSVFDVTNGIGGPACGNPNLPANGAKFDGVVSASQDVTHTYTPAGSYTPKVIIEHSEGAATATKTVIVTVVVSPGLPIVITKLATVVDTMNVTLKGEVDPNNADATVWFRYRDTDPMSMVCSISDDTDMWGTRVPTSAGSDQIFSGDTVQAFSETMVPPADDTTYYYCAFASNSEGSAAGDVKSFFVPASLPPEIISPPPFPVLSADVAPRVFSYGDTYNDAQNVDLSATGEVRLSETSGIFEASGFIDSETLDTRSFTGAGFNSLLWEGEKPEEVGIDPAFVLQNFAFNSNAGLIGMNCNLVDDPDPGTPPDDVDGDCIIDGSMPPTPVPWGGGDWKVEIDADTGIYSGWAWSDTIGWLSFNCKTDTNCDDLGPNDYFVSELVTVYPRRLDGWVWSASVGWIAMSCDSPGLDPLVYCGVNWDIGTDGAVGNANSVWVDGTGAYHGWGWSDNIGWVSFDCSQTADPDYNCALGDGGPDEASQAYQVTRTTVGGGTRVRLWLATADCPNAETNPDTCTTPSTEWEFRGGTTCVVYPNDAYEPDSGVPFGVPPVCYPHHWNKRYFRYRVQLCSFNDCLSPGSQTPIVRNVTVNWSP